MRHVIVLPLTLSFMATCVLAQNSPPVGNAEKKKNLDPNAAQIVATDIDLFWKAYDLAKPENDLIVFRDQYLRKGSVGLKEFTRARISSSCGLVDAIEKHPKYYASLRENTLKVDSYKDSIRASFRRLKELYGGAIFPDVYFLIGRLNSAGTLTDQGLLIGLDMFGRTTNISLEELSDWHKAVIKSIENIPFVVAHELIHYQQNYPKGESTLLAKAIDEGSADFIGELISGKTSNDHLRKYGDPRERDLWAEFSQQMDGKDVSNWLYQGDRAKDRPADLGYFVGYKICESYYKQATDKRQAIKDILEIQDFKQFLKASDYESKFLVSPQASENEPSLDRGVSPHAGLDQIYRRFSEGYKKFDPELVANLYSDDALYLTPGSAIQRGRKIIQENFAGFFRSVKERGVRLEISFRIVERRVSGALAYDVGIYTLSQLRDGSEPRTSRGKFVLVARRMDDGLWRFQVDSYSDLKAEESK